MRYIDADALKHEINRRVYWRMAATMDGSEDYTMLSEKEICELIDKMQTEESQFEITNEDIQLPEVPAAEEVEKPFITACRNASIEQNLPLYFVYYGETGILDVYVTETKELFEKRHCSKHLPDYKFRDMVINYLDWYSDWKEVGKNE